MKKGKSIFLLLLVFGFLICITACDSTNNSNSSEIQIVNASTDNKDVSIEVVNTKKIKDDISVDIKWNNTSSKIIEYGKAFSVYYLDGNDWKTVDKKENIIWTTESLLVYPNDSELNITDSSNIAKINISSYYDIEEEKNYRLVINFSYNDNSTEKYEVVIEFKT